MKRVRREEAASRIGRRIRAMSQEMREVEDGWLSRVELRWWESMPAARRFVERQAARSGLSNVARSERVQRWMVEEVDALVELALPDVKSMVEDVATTALRSMTTELRLCEAVLSLPDRGSGAWKLGIEGGERMASEQLPILMEVFAAGAHASVGVLPGLMSQQLGLAVLEDESVEQAMDRLFSPERVNLPGVGRGVWWTPLSGMLTLSRGMSVAYANDVREAAMKAFNDGVRTA